VVVTHRLQIEGRDYAWDEAGEGTPLLLLHGFPLTGASFWPQLDAPPPGFRVIAPDHRGFGRSALGDGPAAIEAATMEVMADDALALLDHLQLGPVVVGGVSMGGYVALALARLDPGRVRGLVLIDTQAGADDEAGRARREATAASVLEQGVGGLVDTMVPRLFAPSVPADVKARVDAMMRAQSPQAVAAASRGMATRADSKELLSRFAGPALIIVGEHDVITPVPVARAMSELLQHSTLEIIRDAGHLANLEQPLQVNEALKAFSKAFDRS
jgi:pimeloyl-ACP methyl ester carboxylesterase